MKIRFSTAQASLCLSGLVVSTILVTTIAMAQQTADLRTCVPAQGFEFWQSVRLLPIKVTSIENNTVFWEFPDAHGIELGSVVLEKESLIVDTEDKKRDRLYFEFNATKSKWVIVYEAKCYTVLKATQLK
jgi:hypothetical protein